MATFLFIVQPAMGHLNPILTIAKALRTKNHTIVFAGVGLPKIRKVIIDSGFYFENIKPSINLLGLWFVPLLSGYMETFVAVRLFCSRISHYTCAIRCVLDKLRPDALVSDFAFPGASLAAESKDIPYVIVYHAGLGFKGPGIPPFGSGLPIGEFGGLKRAIYCHLSFFLEKSVDKLISRSRKRLNLPTGKDYLTIPSSPWLNLVLTTEASEAPRFPLPETTFFIGPCFAGRQNLKEKKFSFDKLSAGPKIYVSLGTVFNNKPKVFKKIINAFANKPYQLIISAGQAFSKLSCQNSNILLFENVPQIEILPYVDAVISHGGNNTVNETLAAGKPMLIMPVGGEQADNASRVVYLGAGLRTDIKKATSEEIYIKVKRLIEEECFLKCTKEIANTIALTQGPVTAARFIEYVAQNKQPLRRPKGYPLTITCQTVPPWAFTKVV